MNKIVEKEKTINDINARVELIKLLIPLGLEAVRELLEEEVCNLVGEKYNRQNNENTRWGSNPGSVYLGDQKVSVKVPRVRNKDTKKEVELSSYARLKGSGHFNEQVFNNVINGISTRKYEKAAEQIPETFGIKKSSVSRKFVLATAKRLRELLERDLSQEDIVSIFIDGKSMLGVQVLIALGVTIKGKKIPLGFIETATENSTVCKDFLNRLKDRGLNTKHEILFVVDGSKGILKGIKSALGDNAVIQRCQWHKRENVVSYLSKNLQGDFRRKLQVAYEQDTYDKAKSRLMSIRKELSLINEDAAKSLDEGLEETLTIHRLGVFNKIGKSFKTTNCIENLNREIERYTGRICKWKNSNQRQRWIASVLLEMEAKFKVVEGYKQLPLLRQAMKDKNLKIAA